MKMQRHCSLWWRPWWDQLCPCSPWRSVEGKDPPPAHGCPTLEQSIPEGVHPVGGTYTGTSWRSAACGKDWHGRSLLRIVSCGSDPMLRQRTSEERFSSEWGRSSRDDMNWPQPPFAVPLRRERIWEWSWAWEEGKWGEDVLRFSFYFSSSHSDLIGCKFSWFPRVKSGLLMIVDAEQSPCPYLDPRALLCFLSPVQLKSEMINGFGGHLISSQGHPTTLLYLRAAPSARLWPLRTKISLSMLSPRTVLEQAFFA